MVALPQLGWTLAVPVATSDSWELDAWDCAAADVEGAEPPALAARLHAERGQVEGDLHEGTRDGLSRSAQARRRRGVGQPGDGARVQGGLGLPLAADPAVHAVDDDLAEDLVLGVALLLERQPEVAGLARGHRGGDVIAARTAVVVGFLVVLEGEEGGSLGRGPLDRHIGPLVARVRHQPASGSGSPRCRSCRRRRPIAPTSRRWSPRCPCSRCWSEMPSTTHVALPSAAQSVGLVPAGVMLPSISKPPRSAACADWSGVRTMAATTAVTTAAPLRRRAVSPANVFMPLPP